MTRYIALFATVLLGCSGPTEYVLEIDPDYSKEEVKVIQEAADAWEFAGEGSFRFKSQRGLPSRGCETVAVRKLTAPPAYEALTLRFRRPFCYRAEVLMENVSLHLALHELGHALELEHSSDENDVMHPYARSESITESDKEQLRAYQ